MNWLIKLYLALGLYLTSLVISSSERANQEISRDKSAQCQAIEAIARGLSLINEASPSGFCHIHWDMRQVLQESFEPLPEAYKDLNLVISDPRLIELEYAKNFLILSGERLRNAIIPINIGINQHYFVLRGGLRNAKAFNLSYNGHQPFLKETFNHEEPRDGFSISISQRGSNPLFVRTKCIVQEYFLHYREIFYKDPDPFYNFLFFERIATFRSNLPFRLLNLGPRALVEAGKLIEPMALGPLQAQLYGEAGFFTILLLQLFLSYGQGLYENLQTAGWKWLLDEYMTIDQPLDESKTIDLIVKAYKLLGKDIPLILDQSTRTLLDGLLIMEPQLREHILMYGYSLYPIHTRAIANFGKGSLMKLLPLQATEKPDFVEPSIIINDEHKFRLFAYIQYKAQDTYGVFLEQSNGYTLISLEHEGMGAASTVISRTDSAVRFGDGVYFYRYQPPVWRKSARLYDID